MLRMVGRKEGLFLLHRVNTFLRSLDENSLLLAASFVASYFREHPKKLPSTVRGLEHRPLREYFHLNPLSYEVFFLSQGTTSTPLFDAETFRNGSRRCLRPSFPPLICAPPLSIFFFLRALFFKLPARPSFSV